MITLDFRNRKPDLIIFHAFVDVYFKLDAAPYVPSTIKWEISDCDKTITNVALANPVLKLTIRAH